MFSLSWHSARQALYFVLWIVFTFYVLNQARKPNRWIGRFFLWIMNKSHSGVTDWGLSHVQFEKHFTILDVGCGGGRTIEKMAALAPVGKIFGVDYADGSVAASSGKNARLIQAGRLEIQQGCVSKLPFPDGKFDLVTAVETQYYWPDLANDMREILRVLRPGGTLVVIAESYRKGAHNAMQRPVMKLLRSSNLGVDDQRELFGKAGYTDIQIFEERSKGWICATGKKAI